MTNIKKHLKNTAIFAGCFFTVILLAFVVYFQFLQQVPMKSKNILLNDSYDSLTQAMPHGGTISQRLTVEGNISGLGLQINKVSDTLDGRMKIHVEDENGNVLHDGDIGFSRVIPNAYTCFALDNPASYREPTELKIEIHTVYADENIAPGQMISLRKSARQHDSFGRLTENGKSATGSLAVLLITDMLGTSPIKLFLIFALLAAVFCGGIALLCFSFKAKKELVVFAALFSIGLLYQIILPPFSAPDEFIHYNSAYNLSNKWMGVESDIDGGVLKRECDAQSRFTDYRTTAFTYKYIYENFTRPNTNDNYVFAGEEYLKGYNAPRLLSAVSLTFCRTMNFGGVFTAYFVRFVNMLFYCAMMSLAFCLLPIGKNSMLALSALPIAIHLGGSYSYDSFLIAISSVLTALCFNCILSEKKISRIKMAYVAGLCFILAPLKNAYFLLVLLPLLIPAERFKDKKTAYLFKAAVIVVSAVHFSFYNLSLVKSVISAPAVQETVSRVADSRTSSNRAVNSRIENIRALPRAVSNFTIPYMLAHPVVLIRLLLNTFFEQFTSVFMSLFGGTLGYVALSEVNINVLIVMAFIFIFIFTSISKNEDEKTLPAFQRLFLTAIAIVTFGILVAGCITWTPMDYTSIWGFQGRYMLPVMMCLALAAKAKKIILSKDITSVVIFSCFALNILTLLNAAIIIFSR